MSATPPEPNPLEKVDGWSLWPVIDGIHVATRDTPLSDREVRALTLVRVVYADSHDLLLDKIAGQNQLAAEVWRDYSVNGDVVAALQEEYGTVWIIGRKQDGGYRAERRWKLRPNQLHCGLTDEVERRSFAEFKTELDVQRGLWRALIDFGKKPVAS